MGAYQVVARNFSEAHENKIHDDEIARKYGFEGALVPGVAVYGHLTYPLVEKFGDAWLGHSIGSVRFLKPAYHGDRLDIAYVADDAGHHVSCVNQHGVLLAELHSTMPDVLPEIEDQSIFDNACKPVERLDMTWDTVHPLQPFKPWHWQITDDGNQTSASQILDEQSIFRTFAHPHWLLSMANRTLTREYIMPAWIHVGSETRYHLPLRVGDTLEVRAVVLEKWQKKGHEFLRIYVAYYRGHKLATEIFHTVIFKVAR